MSMIQFWALLLGLAVLAVVVAIGWVLWRRQSLRSTFGPEYDRAVAEHASRAEAERELRQRQRRHSQLNLKPLSTSERERFAREWRAIQARFVDEPRQAVRAADDLLTSVAAQTGYPTEDTEAWLADMSVDHAEGTAHYRQAHEVVVSDGRGEPTTEQLRQALVHYRHVFDEMVGDVDEMVGAVAGRATRDGAATGTMSDATMRDGGMRDGGMREAGMNDASVRDGTMSDASVGDGTMSDASTRDADVSDASLRGDGGDGTAPARDLKPTAAQRDTAAFADRDPAVVAGRDGTAADLGDRRERTVS